VSLVESVDKSHDIGSLNVPTLMHRAGINLRYIGYVIKGLENIFDLVENKGMKFTLFKITIQNF
jgi:hypothetical protein